MHAIRQHEFGPPETLRYEEFGDPEPGDGQVRLAVEASGVHLLDTTIRAGKAGGPFPLPELPMTPGREAAGRVEAVGGGVDAAWIGRRAVAHFGLASGGYAERAVVAEASLHDIGELDAGIAVAMIGTGRTAVGVLDAAAIGPDDVVLVLSAAGGLGTLFVQSAKHAGATVIGAAGGATKVDRVRSNGADVAVDYGPAGWTDELRDSLGDREVTLVLDGVGGELGRAAFDLLGGGGRFVMFGFSAGTITEFAPSDLVGRGLTVLWALGAGLLRRPGALRELETRSLEQAATGHLVPAVTAFPLREAAEAHRALEERRTIGKVVLLPDA